MKKRNTTKGGYILIQVIVFASIAAIIITALISAAAIGVKLSRHAALSEQAFQIAEAGVEYYRWHLAHSPVDFEDGTGEPGPYVHDFNDKDGNKLGEFSLAIDAPLEGSTVVTVTSTGTTSGDSDVSRTIRVRMAIPSFAKYAVVANDNMRFGEGTEVFGPIHSNGGIRFDGLTHNLITSSEEEYDDPDHDGESEFGVHTHISPTDPSPSSEVPYRPDVFEAGRTFPAPTVDFVGLTSDLSQMKSDAQSDGYYFSSSGEAGYHVVLKTNDTFDLYRVTELANVPDSSCSNTQSQSGWGTWSIEEEELVATYDNPSSGIVFLEDHVWVSGQVDGARITIVAGKFPDSPSNWRSITVNEDLLYTNYDGSDVISLIAQNNINTGLYSEDDLRIDAALIAQHGRVGRFYYPAGYSWWFWVVPGCSPYYERDTLTLYGMIATNNRYGFAYVDGTGYEIREIIYDPNLLYSPPPSFPLTSDQYQILSWEEIE